MKITNPTNQDIKNIQIGENVYSIEAGGTLKNVPEKDARYWQENLHKFLVLKKDELEEVKTNTVEIPTPKVETVEEEPIIEEEKEEVKIEAPIVKEKKSIFSNSKK